MSDHTRTDGETVEDFDLDLELDMDAPLGAAFAAAVRGADSDPLGDRPVSLSEPPAAREREPDWAASDPWSSFAKEPVAEPPNAPERLGGDGARSSFVDRLLAMDEGEDTDELSGPVARQMTPSAFPDAGRAEAKDWSDLDETGIEDEYPEPALTVFHDDPDPAIDEDFGEAEDFPEVGASPEFDVWSDTGSGTEPVQKAATAEPSVDIFSAVHAAATARKVELHEEPAPPPPLEEERDVVEAAASDAAALDYGFSSAMSGGDRMVPRITIHAFCTKTPVLGVMRAVTRDRRMRNVTMEVHEGGVKAAIQHYASETTPNLLLLEGAGDPVRLLQELDALAEYCDENIRVIIIGETNDIRLYRELMRRGVSEYLVAPIDPVQLIRAISGLFTDPDAPFTGKTLAVTGVKGGVGASSIAHNLAWALSERIKVNATLVDLDLNFGTTGLDFNQDPTATIADALMSPERFDEAVMGRLITRATDRLSLFAAPATLDRTYDLDPETYSHVLEMVRGSVPFVVLDMPHIWTDWFKSTIVGADEVVVVSGPDLASLRNGKNLIDFLKAARPHDAPPKLVLNMVGIPKRPEIPAKDFGQAMGLQPSLVLPFEPQVFGTAANNGQMIFDVAGESKCAQAIDQLATMLTGKELQTAKPSLLKKLLLGK